MKNHYVDVLPANRYLFIYLFIYFVHFICLAVHTKIFGECQDWQTLHSMCTWVALVLWKWKWKMENAPVNIVCAMNVLKLWVKLVHFLGPNLKNTRLFLNSKWKLANRIFCQGHQLFQTVRVLKCSILTMYSCIILTTKRNMMTILKSISSLDILITDDLNIHVS